MNHTKFLLTISLSLAPQTLLQGSALDIFRDHTNADHGVRKQQAIVNTKRSCAKVLKTVGGLGAIGYYCYAVHGYRKGKPFKELFPRKHIIGASMSALSFLAGNTWSEELDEWQINLVHQARRERAHRRQRRREEQEIADAIIAADLQAKMDREVAEEQQRQHEALLQRQEAEYQTRQRKRTNAPKECPICAEEKPGTEFPALACKHSMCCLGCLQGTIDAALEEGQLQKVCCSDPTCKKVLAAVEINHILTPEQHKKYTELQEEAKARVQKDMAKCPKPGCNRRFKTTQAPQAITCDKCATVCCSACAKPHSNGVQSCAETARREAQAAAQAERNKTPRQRAEEAISKRSIKPCPDCGIPTVKDEMCKWVKCDKCNYNFCWACLKGGFTQSHQEHPCTVDHYGWGAQADNARFGR